MPNLKGRKVILTDTGKIGNSLSAFKASNKKYYSSEDAFLMWELNNHYKNKCTDEIYKLLGYEKGMKISTLWFKKLNEWNYYGYQVVLRSIQNKSKNIVYSIETKEFNSENNMIKYITTIIENGLNDAKRNIKNETRQKRKDTDNIDINENIDINNINRKQKNKDISAFL